ncbi:hypothetical protein SAMN02745181_3376 [Rubritalea squalenifaciens DSM 18772]|uniref:Lipoprotein n=1 Tax=Rubritalea squalenifaciens DSM 18772 TaxID=1123071 RepID=A0A1M6QET0_9BACT|nr:hypothetical protein [Rubritalea squalenifaciens]SHK18675.1 hypothetical protein SAMN02745181_3376 [Rubritalea squalenifaciens DSM 18772]
MFRYTIIPAAIVLASCSTSSKLNSPVSLPDAIRTLPPDAVAGMSHKGRKAFIELMPKHEGVDTTARTLHYYSDSPERYPDPSSMFFLRLFEDESGRTIAASHTARPHGIGTSPSESDTLVYRLEKGQWINITSTAIPEQTRTWWFKFNQVPSPCGPYLKDTLKNEKAVYRIGNPAGYLSWKDNAFRLSTSTL